jgi:hypothetical protein
MCAAEIPNPTMSHVGQKGEELAVSKFSPVRPHWADVHESLPLR